ncbi:hypothetical protein BJ742DRAFT_388716 [Cladochytrium replicatum]|nr:hypothetical protein BJ742DRAFT_388716 [Cladochytrium replicatum]
MSRAIALFECAADDPAELSFPSGATLVDVEPAEDPDWFVGRIEGTNAVGLFPGNYVRFEAAKSRSAANTPKDPPALTFTSNSDDEQLQFPRPLTRLPDTPEPKFDAAALRNALKDKTDHLAAMAREKLSSSNTTTYSTVAPAAQNRSRALSEQTSSVPPPLPPRLPPRPPAPPTDPPQKSSPFPPATHTSNDYVQNDVIATRKPSMGSSDAHPSISALAAKFSDKSAPEAPKRPVLLQSNRDAEPPPTPSRSTSNTASPIPSAVSVRNPSASGPAPPPPAPRKPANLRSPALPQQRSVTSPPAIPSTTTKSGSDDENVPPASVKPSDLKKMWESRSTPNQQPLFATKSRPPPPPASKKLNLQQSNNLETPPPLPRRAVSDSAANSNFAKGQWVSTKIPPDANRRYGTLFDQLASELDPADVASGNTPARSWSSASHGTRLGGTVIRKVWLRSGLDNKVLGSIWQLVDTMADGELDKTRFCIGMHLIDERLRGYPIPEELPRELQLLMR